MLISFDDALDVLNGETESLPAQIFERLNGGIILVPGFKLHPEARSCDLYIMGEYHFDPSGLGRYITIYYGSFERTYSHLSADEQAEQFRRVLRHELTHHLESLAGDKSLELKDKAFLDQYKSSQTDNEKE